MEEASLGIFDTPYNPDCRRKIRRRSIWSMPELPEVEITRRGIKPHIQGRRITALAVRNRHLRWPVPTSLQRILIDRTIEAVDRRGKYLLLRSQGGTLIVHLGMSGSLRVLRSNVPAGVHDHVDVIFGDVMLRLRDPRRFGAVLWHPAGPEPHKLLRHLGPEPLGEGFTGEYLFRASRKRRVAIKPFLMNHLVVVGVGNIYASEALFRSGIHPALSAGKLSRERCEALVKAIRQTLEDALKAGGSTLRDFVGSDGKQGYFQHQRTVYDREGEPCRVCRTPIKALRQGQRSTFFCPVCQRR